jgi:acetyltransferase-like isoleucine patch superfamily enzyme
VDCGDNRIIRLTIRVYFSRAIELGQLHESMSDTKTSQFIRKYRFPVHLIVVRDIIAYQLSVVFWTTWSRIVFAIHGCKVGPGLTVDGHLIIRTAAKGGITIGKGFRVSARRFSNLAGINGPSILYCVGDGRITIGDNSGISGAVLCSRSEIRIGNQVNIGVNVRIFDNDFHSVNAKDRRDFAVDKQNCKSKPVVIEDDVLIGADAIILKGVRIGARSIVGAGAVVTLANIPPDSVVAGNPARIVSTNSIQQNVS